MHTDTTVNGAKQKDLNDKSSELTHIVFLDQYHIIGKMTDVFIFQTYRIDLNMMKQQDYFRL